MRRILTVLLLTATTIISSCTKTTEELPTPNTTNPITPVKVEMNFSPESLEVTSRAISAYTIDDINIYMYGTKDYHIYTEDTALNFEIMPGKYKIYVVSNIGRDLGEMSESSVKYIESTKLTMESRNNIPMSTELEVTIPSNAPTYSIPDIKLLRSAAKISLNVSVDSSIASSITLRSVTLCNLPTSCSPFDTTSTPSANINDYVDSEPIDADGSFGHSEIFYMFENRQGTVSSITDQRDKSPENAPDNATYVMIEAVGNKKILQYVVYLGENNTSDFNVRRNTQHTMNIVIMGEDDVDNRTTVYDGIYYGTANCIINTGTSVTFDITPYRTSKELSYRYTGVKAGATYDAYNYAVAWQDKMSLVSGFSRDGNMLTVNTSGAEGNAVVVLFNAINQVVWSFHIWCTDKPYTYTFAENSLGHIYTVMDRNLGATTPAMGSVSSYGLFYQWGRKDPFIRASVAAPESTGVMHENNGAIYTITNTELTFADYCLPTPTNSTIYTAITNPKNLYYQSGDHSNWYDAGAGGVNYDPYLWGSASIADVDPPKTVYDPSPMGYKVPPYDFFLVFNKNGTLSDGTFDHYDVENHFTYGGFYRGWRFYYDGEGASTSKVMYFPACGMRANSSYYKGGLSGVGTSGLYWSSTNKSYTSNYNYRFSESLIYVSSSNNASVALSVRCIRE